jgi:hypothetical protein
MFVGRVLLARAIAATSAEVRSPIRPSAQRHKTRLARVRRRSPIGPGAISARPNGAHVGQCQQSMTKILIGDARLCSLGRSPNISFSAMIVRLD